MITNRKELTIALFLVLTLLVAVPVNAAPITKFYGDKPLSGGYQAGNFPEVWDLTACGLTLSSTYDGNGLKDIANAHAWAELGVRAVGSGNFNPNGKGVWLATDYDWKVNTFAPDPPGSPTLDLDDKLILQKQSGQGEGAYNLPSTPPIPGNNHRVWWDRDGVDPWQNPETANTGGTYPIVITLHATSATAGEAYMKIRGLDQGFEVDGNWNTIELTPAGMTYTGDMAHMQVFYGIYGYGATHSIQFKDITVTGCLAQYPQTFTASGLEADATGTVVTVSSVPVAASALPYTVSADWGSTVAYSYESIVGSSVTGKQYSPTTPAPSPASGYTVTGANTITGTYKTQYYLTVNSAYDTLDGQGWYDSGTTAYATLASGTVSGGAGTQYVFTGWSGDASGTALTSNGITMDGPKTATANWKTQYYLTISVSPSGSGTATPVPVGPWYDSGTPVQVTAMPASGYTFGSWLLDGSSPAGSTITPITVTMNAPHNLVAQFLSPNAIKSSVLQDLITLRDGGTVTDKGDLNKLDEAIKHLTKSLDPELWADETHLQTKHGEKVFNEEKDAVVKLVELMKDKKSTIPDATLQGFIDRLVNADRLLVSAAIHDVVTAGGDPKKINKANEELSKGDARSLDGKFVDAIEHYRNAWNHAIQSV